MDVGYICIKQHRTCLYRWEGTIVLDMMYFHDEIRKPESADGKGDLRKPEIQMARTLVENLSSDFKPEKYDDTYRKELLALLKEKAETGEISPPPAEEGEEGEVVDLMVVLRESVERTKQQKKRPSPRKSGSARKTGSTRKTPTRKAS